MASVSYDFLLDLYRGKASAVEQISEQDLSAISISTPLTRFIEQADSSGTPRHILLTGNAGDGKTFAARCARSANFEKILDASEDYASSIDPLGALAAHLEGLLSDKKRLLIAINRGQMDRLIARLAERSYPRTSEIISVARDQLKLSIEQGEPAAEIAAIDLGLIDTLGDSILLPLLERVATMEVVDLPNGPTRTSLLAAQEALRDHDLRERVIRVIRTARLSIGHATMRQLWSLGAFLLTGGRDARDSTPATLADSVGARLFSASNRAALAYEFRLRFDPGFEPQPVLARSLLDREWREALSSLPGLANLRSLSSTGDSGLEYVRAAAIHGSADYNPAREPSDTYGKAVRQLTRHGPGWQPHPRITIGILNGIYHQLELGRSGEVFPAWTRLCFDATRIPRAGSVAIANVRHEDLRLAVPYPPAGALEAFGAAWWAPHVLMGFDGDDRHPLRITPRMFRILYDPSRAASLNLAELLILERWLAGVPVSKSNTDAVMVSASPGTLHVTRDPLDEKVYIHLEGQTNA